MTPRLMSKASLVTVMGSRSNNSSKPTPLRGAAYLGVRRQGEIVADYSLRFDDATLQERFLAGLTRSGVPHHRTDNGTVECSEAEWGGVNGIAHKIRDSCYPWYFSWPQSPADSEEFLVALRKSRLPFQLEHHEDRLVFLLARQHESDYNDLLAGS